MRRSAIGIAVAACAFLLSSAPAAAHHDEICPVGPLCIIGHEHLIDDFLADPTGELGDAVREIMQRPVGYVPNEVCVPNGEILVGNPDGNLCVTGLQETAQRTSDEGASAVCALWTAAGWRCD